MISKTFTRNGIDKSVVTERAEYDADRAASKAEKIAEARRLKEEGYSMRAIARAMGVNDKSVRNWLK